MLDALAASGEAAGRFEFFEKSSGIGSSCVKEMCVPFEVIGQLLKVVEAGPSYLRMLFELLEAGVGRRQVPFS